MSIEAMSIAINHSRAKGTSKLVLLGIANHAGDGGAWPAMATLAKYGSCSVRRAREAVVLLESLGEVKRLIQAGGDENAQDHMRPNLYKFLLKCPPECDGSTNHRHRSAPLFETVEAVDKPPAESRPPAGTRPSPRRNLAAKPSPNLSTNSHSSTQVGRAAKWLDDRCPGDWKTQQHELHPRTGKCAHCFEAPIEAR